MKKHRHNPMQDLRGTKTGQGRGCYKPAGSKTALKKMGWAMLRVFHKEELMYPRGMTR